jgi:type IV pilus assembly protein PilA
MFRTGFTLIELMIVVAIIGIIAAIFIPVIQDARIRDQITESLDRTAPIRASTVKYFNETNLWPANLADIGFSEVLTGPYTSSIKMEAGTITITFGSQANPRISGKSLSVKPLINAKNQVVWVCGKAAVPADALEALHSDSGTNITSADWIKRSLPTGCFLD